MEVLTNILTKKDKMEVGKGIGKTNSTFFLLRKRRQG